MVCLNQLYCILSEHIVYFVYNTSMHVMVHTVDSVISKTLYFRCCIRCCIIDLFHVYNFRCCLLKTVLDFCINRD